LDQRMEQLENERDILQRANEGFKQDMVKTKDNMSHYRSSCQKLSKELESANFTIEEIQNKYEILLRKEDEKHMQRMDSGSSLGGIEDLLDKSGEEEEQNVETQDQEILEENLGDELNELAGFGDDDGLIDGDFVGGDDDNDGIIDMDNSGDELQQFDNDIEDHDDQVNQDNLDHFEPSNEADNLVDAQVEDKLTKPTPNI
jgi:chromosome segregation ATPase